MPKASRNRPKKHHDSVKLSKTSQLSTNDDALPSLPLPSTDDAVMPIDQPVSEIPNRELPVQRSKKEKQIQKREAFLQKLNPSVKEISKSQQRRLKRKAKQELSGGLNELQSAIVSLEKEDISDDEHSATGAESSKGPSKSAAKPGTIGKSQSAPLSKAQRKRALELERLRHPLILTNPEFSSNPFQTIRTHAKNTLLPQKLHK